MRILKKATAGRVIYNPKEKGFDTLPDVKSDIALLIAYVNIGFDADTMCANQVFGLSPEYSWIRCKLFEPQSLTMCALKLDEEFDYGTWRLDRDNEWKTFFDAESGWICIGNPGVVDGNINICFIDHAVAVLNTQGEMQALWMKPHVSESIPLSL